MSATLDRTVYMRLRHNLVVVNQSEGTAIVERWRCSGSTTVVDSATSFSSFGGCVQCISLHRHTFREHQHKAWMQQTYAGKH